MSGERAPASTGLEEPAAATPGRGPRVLYADGALPEGAGAEALLAGDAAHHLLRVLRARPGDALELFDGRGRFVSAVLVGEERGGKRRGEAVAARVRATGPSAAGVGADAAGAWVLQGFPKGDKLDAVLRQGTELGAAALWPVYTARSVARPRGGGADEAARRARYEGVVASAAAQCGRSALPRVCAPCELDEALERLPSDLTLRLLAWEGGGEPLGAVLRAAARARREGAPWGGCALLVGPEGGLEAREVARAQRAAGFVAVCLGPRILRTETAAPALLAQVSLALGDLAEPFAAGAPRG